MDTQSGRDEAALRQYVENMARVLADWGFPRMAGRVLMQLMASDEGAMTAADLAESLEISPPAVSGAVRYLQHIGLIEREPVPGSRRDRYRLPDDAWYMGAVTKGTLFNSLSKLAAEGVEAAGGRDTPAGTRIADMGDFYSFIQGELGSMLGRYKDHREALGLKTLGMDDSPGAGP